MQKQILGCLVLRVRQIYVKAVAISETEAEEFAVHENTRKRQSSKVDASAPCSVDGF